MAAQNLHQYELPVKRDGASLPALRTSIHNSTAARLTTDSKCLRDPFHSRRPCQHPVNGSSRLVSGRVPLLLYASYADRKPLAAKRRNHRWWYKNVYRIFRNTIVAQKIPLEACPPNTIAFSFPNNSLGLPLRFHALAGKKTKENQNTKIIVVQPVYR